MTCRPKFISQSMQRVKRLALQVEERRLQEVFSREREELFSRPGGPGRLPKPAGTQQETPGGESLIVTSHLLDAFSVSSLQTEVLLMFCLTHFMYPDFSLPLFLHKDEYSAHAP